MSLSGRRSVNSLPCCSAISIRLTLKLLRHLQLGLPAQFPGNNLAGPLANAVGDIVAGDVEGLAVLSDAAHEDMGVRVAGVVVIDRDPVKLRPKVGFHLGHQMAGGLARVGQLRAVLGRDDEAELMAVVASPLQESAAILHIAFTRIDLALLTILRHAVPFEIAQMRVDRLGADKLPPRTAPRCGLSFTTRAFTAKRRARVRAPLASRLHALRSLRLSAVAAPRPRALNLPPPFPVPGFRFGLPPARRIARWTSPMKLVGRPRAAPIRRAASCPPPRSRTLPGRIRKSSSLRAMRRRLEVERYRARPEMQSA